MNEKKGFSWGTFWAGIFTGGFLLFLLIIVPAMLNVNARRSGIGTQEVAAQGQTMPQDMADAIRARGLHMTGTEQSQAMQLKLFFMSGGMQGEGDSEAIAEAALKQSRREGIPFGAAIMAQLGMDEKLYAAQPMRARGNLDSITEYDASTIKRYQR